MGWWHLCFGDGYIETLIIYGRVTNPDTVAVGIINKSRDDRVLLSENHALLSPETPGLRFSSSGWFDLRSVGQLEINTFELLLAITKEKILSRISPFSIISICFINNAFKPNFKISCSVNPSSTLNDFIKALIHLS